MPLQRLKILWRTCVESFDATLGARLRRGDAGHTARSAEVLRQLDMLLLERHQAAYSELNTAMAGLLQELKNEMGPVMWSLEFAHASVKDAPEAQQALTDGIENLGLAMRATERFLVELQTKGGERHSFWLADMLRPGRFEQNPAHHIEIVCENLPNVRVYGPGEHLRVALCNLFENAAEAGATCLVLTGEVLLGGTKVSLRIADNGHGMPGEVKGRMFEPFNTHDKKAGAGLGTYLSRRMVEALGGTLTLLDSDSDGTCFEIALPISSTRASLAPPSFATGS
ncbi:MAG: HAMP domain-containing sensor histidine kinase [Deltaproteobacteria bacterium]|nr:HAMP domain-containing sensor histidine kinase [Deltaproteobacteria bacterium]